MGSDSKGEVIASIRGMAGKLDVPPVTISVDAEKANKAADSEEDPEAGHDRRAKHVDPRFLRPRARPRIKEDSGTYSVLLKSKE